MIVITGATGALNGATVEHLLKRIPADQIGLSVRDTAKAQHFADRGVRVRRGSYENPAALLDSFEGAEQVLLVSSNDPGADGVGLLRVGVETAVAAGARRILYTSHQHTGLDSPFFPARDHAATEALLADSGVAWTSLRNGFYAHSLDWLLGPWRETGVIATPADGAVSWTERADEAEAAAVILAGERRFDGPVALAIGRVDLLCLDELGYLELDRRGAELLFQVFTEREERASIAIASNAAFSEWTSTFTDPRLCAAIVDRLTFDAHIITTGTDSYRLRTAQARHQAPRA